MVLGYLEEKKEANCDGGAGAGGAKDGAQCESGGKQAMVWRCAKSTDRGLSAACRRRRLIGKRKDSRQEERREAEVAADWKRSGQGEQVTRGRKVMAKALG